MNLSFVGTALRLPVAILLTVGGTLLVGSLPSSAQEAATAKAAPATATPAAATATAKPIAQGQRVFSVGHSFHVFMPAILRDMAQAAEIKDHIQVGLSSIGGSRVIQHWNVPDDTFKAKASLRSGKVDVLTLAPIYLPAPAILSRPGGPAVEPALVTLLQQLAWQAAVQHPLSGLQAE